MGFVSKLLSFGADKELKRYQKTVVKINDLEPTYTAMSDEELRQQTELFRGRLEAGGAAGRPAARGLRGRARDVAPRHRDAPLRRAAHRRHGPARGPDRGDEDGRGQDPRVHARRLPQRARGQGRAHRHRERLPRQARLRVDGPHLPVPGDERGPAPERHAARPEAPRLRRRRHLRHELRVRLRLPARQHGRPPAAARPARSRLRHRRRGRLHPRSTRRARPSSSLAPAPSPPASTRTSPARSAASSAARRSSTTCSPATRAPSRRATS